METREFDADGLFDEDYLYFYADRLSAAQSDADVELLWRLLDLEPGMDVLDLACGHGRIAVRLAERGCRVTGLDASGAFLDLARQSARDRGVAVEFVQGDMRALPWAGRFDRVVNWFTAYGYFPDDENRRVLAEVAHVLRPGGRAVFETINQPALLARMLPHVAMERGDDLLVDRNRYDPLTGRVVTERTIVRGGRVRRVPFFVRLLSFPELRDWLLAAGFRDVAGWGEDGEPLSADSRRLVAVAWR